MANKVFKTLDEQIEILKNRGLVIEDEKEARDVLLRENYFFINGYRHLFTKEKGKDIFLDGTTFNELYATFVFDRRLRNIFFKYLLVVENNMKSIISYQLSRKYGYIPLWILVKVLSFGILSELYSILKYDDQIDIAEKYCISPDVLWTYLAITANFRNLCAHEEILYDYRTQRIIPDSPIHSKLNIEKDYDGYKYGKNDLFALLIMLKTFLTDKEFRGLVYEIGFVIDKMDQVVNTVSLDSILHKIGFPSNWKDIVEL